MRFQINAVVLSVLLVMGSAGSALCGGVSLDKSARTQKEGPQQQGGPDNMGDFGSYTAADTNGDTAISKQEWTAFLEQMHASPDFGSVDDNGNGRIEIEEWRKHAEAKRSSNGSANQTR